MIKIETSDHSETISNRFLMSKLIYRMILDLFGTFWFRTLFRVGTRFSVLGSNLPYIQRLTFIYIDIGLGMEIAGMISYEHLGFAQPWICWRQRGWSKGIFYHLPTPCLLSDFRWGSFRGFQKLLEKSYFFIKMESFYKKLIKDGSFSYI